VDPTLDPTLIGILIGGIGRAFPELLKIFNKWMDNNHELKMLEASSKTQEITVDSRVQMSNSTIDYNMIDRIIKVQNTPSGNKKIDIINILVRPSTTYVLLGTYVIIKIWWFYLNPTALLTTIWTADDMTLLGGILGFWFLGRVFDKK
jgi:hypothetical protein